MGQVHVFLKQFDINGVYESNFTEVTDDITENGLGKLRQRLDNTQFDIGVFRNSNVKLTFKNDDGRYSDVGETLNTIFKSKRADTQVKITWEPATKLIPGFFIPGPTAILSEEITMFEGLLNDDSSAEDATGQQIPFNILGKESIFSRVDVPFLSVSNGDLFSALFFTLLNQTKITDLLTVSALNISVGTDVEIDVRDSLENKTVLEAFKSALLASNSVLFVKDNTVFISPRTIGASSDFTFFGEASINGIENISRIARVRTGANRIFNYWTWKDTNILRKDDTSIAKFGISKKELDVALITDTTKRQTILANLRDEFALPKRELKLSAPIDPKLVEDVFLLSKVSIDHPSITIVADDAELPFYDKALYDIARYPDEFTSLIIDVLTDFKVMDREIDLKTEVASYQLRVA